MEYAAAARVISRSNCLTVYSAAWNASDGISDGQLVALGLFIVAIFFATNFDPYTAANPSGVGASLDVTLHVSNAGMIGRRIALPVLALAGGAWLCTHGFKTWRFRGPVAVLLLTALIWSIASAVWADEPQLTARKIVTLMCMWTGAVWVAALVPMKKLPELTVVAVLGLLVLSVGREVYDGGLLHLDVDYRFGGFYHPNNMGQILACGVLAATMLWAASRRQAFAIFFLTVFACFLYLTKSRTSLYAIVVSLGATVVLMSVSSRRVFRRLALAVGGIVILGCFAYILFGSRVEQVLANWAVMGRNPSEFGTLSYRTLEWNELLSRFVSQRPFTGYGYDSFWTNRHTIQMSLLVPGMIFVHGHSGYLELVLGVGIIGAALHVGYMLSATIISVRQHIRASDAGSAFGFGILVWLLTTMLTEVPNVEITLPTFVAMTVIASFAIAPVRASASDERK